MQYCDNCGVRYTSSKTCDLCTRLSGIKSGIKLIAMAEVFAEDVGADFDENESVYIETNEPNDVFEDDAFVHVRKDGIRMVFGFDQMKTRQSTLDRVERRAKKFFEIA